MYPWQKFIGITEEDSNFQRELKYAAATGILLSILGFFVSWLQKSNTFMPLGAMGIIAALFAVIALQLSKLR